MKYYAVFDTNVLISSLLTKRTDTATAQVIEMIPDGRIIPLYNQEILNEYEEVLQRPKFSFSEERISRILKMIRQFGLAVNPTPTGEVLVDMDDLVFYEVVMEKREDDAYLITGNIKHFPERSFIVTPAEMMEILTRENTQQPQVLFVDILPTVYALKSIEAGDSCFTDHCSTWGVLHGLRKR
jgi:putative PIN family toxin of toxin-antitoxin system